MSLESANIPQGCLTMAQRLSVGLGVQRSRRPEGTTERECERSVVPSGRFICPTLDPTLKRWAIVVCPSGTAQRTECDRRQSDTKLNNSHYTVSKGLASRTHPTLLLALHA